MTIIQALMQDGVTRDERIDYMLRDYLQYEKAISNIRFNIGNVGYLLSRREEISNILSKLEKMEKEAENFLQKEEERKIQYWKPYNAEMYRLSDELIGTWCSILGVLRYNIDIFHRIKEKLEKMDKMKTSTENLQDKSEIATTYPISKGRE